MKRKILIADDDKGILKLLEIILKQEGYDIVSASNGKDALEIFRKEDFGIVITDLNMPLMDGRELLRRIKKEKPEIPVVVITAGAAPDKLTQLIKDGAYRVLNKFDLMRELLSILSDIFRQNDFVKDASFSYIVRFTA